MFQHDWPLPDNVAIAMTDRHGGMSLPPFDSLNLGLHVGDNQQHVLANRASLRQRLSLPAEPLWLEQVHGVDVVNMAHLKPHEPTFDLPIKADASYSNKAGDVCAVMTADCLPVLLCNQQGTEVAAAHAGWRGLCAGVIEQTVALFNTPPNELMAYLGPAIGPQAFEVGAEVRDAFMQKHPQAAQYFMPHNNKYLADLPGIAMLRLSHLGVTQVFNANVCTFTNPDYFSYRRDHHTGRMASLIWLKS
ncbi:peptidoglycan editing factor PgeF [Shewanella inventionis]|uniref:Purine nucleoside phosphorylase n=1 Tax=Shewanella inventionis TaxID=1738770 RepID=A0ABQ1J397_9GAMM|nr:peptidoglycan editing factor PgeF [Shewanella inventionis]MCL1158491.1 peptidoglycan editing factor PgeF [Shewanella inventionis]UAL42970.1 peptidoglycan editing factor PgeF [Shewanella inventionis]GGB56348.1 laccase domain protein [Shewanella inventionis]